MSAKKSARGAKGPIKFSLTIDGPDAAWAGSVLRVAKEHGKSPEQATQEALREWLWHASGLKRMFEQVRESGEMMGRSFQVEGMLVHLAKSGGISLGQQTEYLKRAKEERAFYDEQRKKVVRLVRDIRRAAAETGLPDAIEAAAKLVVPE